MLSLQNIKKSYATHNAVNDVSFEVPNKAIFGLLGPNGAGKTTLIRIITNIIGADSGDILFNGTPLSKDHTIKIGYLPEERGLYKKMKVGEQLLYLAQLKGLSKKEAKNKIQHWLDKFEITTWKDKKIEELSKGMQQKIQFIATVVHEPELIILDEPFSGLDPVNAELIKNEIFELNNNGTTIIFSTHRMEQVEEICKRIVLINSGNKILEGEVKDIKQQFKKNLFKVVFEGNAPKIDETAFEVKVSSENELLIGLKEKSSRDLLKELVKQNINLISFNEVLPSLNEVFIEQVKEKHA